MNLSPETITQSGLAAVFVAVAIAVWRASKVAWPTFVRWGDRLLDHWIASSTARDTKLDMLISGQKDHVLIDEKHHGESKAHVSTLAEQGRHSTADKLQGMQSSLEASLIEARDYLCEKIDQAIEEIRETRAVVTKIHTEVSGDIPVTHDDGGKQ